MRNSNQIVHIVLYPSDIINPFMKDVSNYILDDVCFVNRALFIGKLTGMMQDIKRILVDKLPPYSRLTVCGRVLCFQTVFDPENKDGV